MKITAILCASALSVVALLVPAQAETIAMSADLSGKNEIPPNDTGATGMADVTYDTATRTLTWKVEFKDLSGPVIGAHIHGPAPSGGNAGVMIGFEAGGSPIQGSATLDDAKEKAVLAGQTYVNIHTQAHPGGELRGQLLKK